MAEADGGAPRPMPEPAGLWSPPYRRLTAGLLLVVAAAAFETLAVATILPLVVRDLGGLALYGWAFSLFTLANLLGIALGGSTADRRGPAPPLAAGIGVFLIGLVGGGLAPTMPVLIASRALQGLGSGLLTAAVYVAIGRSYVDPLQARMLASLSSAWVIPGLVGPAAAGLMADQLGWRWVFLGLMPLPLLAALLLWSPLTHLHRRPEATPRHGRRFADAAQLTLGVGVVLTGLSAALAWSTVGMGLVGVGLSLHAFRRLTPPGTLRAAPGVPATIATMTLLTLAFFGVDVFLPLALTTGRHQPVWVSGLAYTATALGWAAGAWAVERLAARQRHRRLVRAGLLLVALGIGVMVMTTWPAIPALLAIPGWGVAGVGMGLAYTMISLTVLERAPQGQEGTATAAMQLGDRIGTALGAGIGGVIIGTASHDPTTLNRHIAGHYLLMLTVMCLGVWVARRVSDRVGPAAARTPV
jgi:MFS family permease